MSRLDVAAVVDHLCAESEAADHARRSCERAGRWAEGDRWRTAMRCLVEQADALLESIDEDAA